MTNSVRTTRELDLLLRTVKEGKCDSPTRLECSKCSSLS